MTTANKIQRMHAISIPMLGAFLMIFSWGFIARGITVEELQNQLETGDKITIIDIRNQKAYQKNHIPGAINVSANLIPHKKLPPLGIVIVYGDGIHTGTTKGAVEALNQKPGITAEMLEGGISSWLGQNLADSRALGLLQSSPNFLNYPELESVLINSENAVLVDLRIPKKDQELTKIKEQFPNAMVVRPAIKFAKKNQEIVQYDLSEILQSKDNRNSRLFILIDSGGQASEKVYRQLSSGGLKRLAILTGGELALSRQGRGEQASRKGSNP